MLAYASLLDEHIRKEDEVLFPRLDGRLTEGQREELLTRFELSDRNLALDDRKYQSFVERLEQQMH